MGRRATITIPPQFRREVENAMGRLRRKCAAEMIAASMDQLLTHLPQEDGHAHEAWLAAMDDVSSAPELGMYGPAIDRVGKSHRAKASGDPKAANGVPSLRDVDGNRVTGEGGWGMVDDGKGRTEVLLVNELHFVKLMEYGGELVPIAPGGRKVGGRRGRNPFLHPREAGGVGMLMWSEGGSVRIAPTRRYGAGGYTRQAMMPGKRVGRLYGKFK